MLWAQSVKTSNGMINSIIIKLTQNNYKRNQTLPNVFKKSFLDIQPGRGTARVMLVERAKVCLPSHVLSGLGAINIGPLLT